jgi:hypothetical protein
VDKVQRDLVIPAELGTLLDSIDDALTTLEASGYSDDLLPKNALPKKVPAELFSYWDSVATAREEYRESVKVSTRAQPTPTTGGAGERVAFPLLCARATSAKKTSGSGAPTTHGNNERASARTLLASLARRTNDPRQQLALTTGGAGERASARTSFVSCARFARAAHQQPSSFALAALARRTNNRVHLRSLRSHGAPPTSFLCAFFARPPLPTYPPNTI